MRTNSYMYPFILRTTPGPGRVGQRCCRLPELGYERVQGTYESFGDIGVLHLGVTFPSTGDVLRSVYVGNDMVQRYQFRPGDHVRGDAEQGSSGLPQLRRVESINGCSARVSRTRPAFSDLVPVYPDEQLLLAVPSTAGSAALRDIDVHAPIGKGTRALITAPAKAGKTRLLEQIAGSLQTNNPEVALFVLLIGGEWNEARQLRAALPQGEVIHLEAGDKPRNHLRAATMTVEHAKRLVELGLDAAVLIDGLTLLSDSCESVYGSAAQAAYGTRSLFGAARNIENGGSLTIIATAFEREDDETICVMTDASTASIRLMSPGQDRQAGPMIDSARSWSRCNDFQDRRR